MSARSSATRVARTDARPDSPQAVDDALFSELLVRERKRSERANRSFILLTVRMKPGRDRKGSPTAILDALATTTRQTDIAGWLKSPSVIGVIFSEIGTAQPARALETIRSRVRRALRRQLEAGDCTLDFHVYPESGSSSGGTCGPGPVDRLLHPDLVADEQRRSWTDRLKRAFDVFASLALLLALSPLLLITAILVRLTSPGPSLFRQVRLGTMAEPFTMLKFRTMYVGGGDDPHREFVTRFIKSGERTGAPPENGVFKLTNDRRITAIGHLLRKTSIDELPQLWNVLVGDMSLVGPRPPLPYEFEQYTAWHRRRLLEAKPGITGLWQVTGRSRTTFDEMVRLDLRYARARSIWTDMWILVRTPGAVLSGKGAC